MAQKLQNERRNLANVVAADSTFVDVPVSVSHLDNQLYTLDGEFTKIYDDSIMEIEFGDSLDITDEQMFLGWINPTVKTIPKTKSMYSAMVAKAYKCVNLNPRMSELEEGSTGWLDFTTIKAYPARYAMFHIVSKDAETSGQFSPEISQHYTKQMNINPTRIKAQLLKNNYIKAGSHVYAGGATDFTSLDETCKINVQDFLSIRDLLINAGVKIPGQMYVAIPEGTINELYQDQFVVDFLKASLLTNEYYSQGERTLSVAGITFVEMGLLPIIPKNTYFNLLEATNTDVDVGCAMMYIAGTPKNPTFVTLRYDGDQEVEVVTKANGTPFSGDLLDEIRSEAFLLNGGINLMNPEKAITYMFAKSPIAKVLYDKNDDAITEFKNYGQVDVTNTMETGIDMTGTISNVRIDGTTVKVVAAVPWVDGHEATGSVSNSNILLRLIDPALSVGGEVYTVSKSTYVAGGAEHHLEAKEGDFTLELVMQESSNQMNGVDKAYVTKVLATQAVSVVLGGA